MVDEATNVVLAEALAADNDEVVRKALTRETLYERVFPRGPKLDDADDEEREVADLIATYVWSMTTASVQGRIQRRIAEIEGNTDVMLCRRKINGVMTVYATRNDDLVWDDFVLPGSEKLVAAANKTRKDMDLAGKRRKALESRIQGELASVAARTSHALGVSTTPTLTSGS